MCPASVRGKILSGFNIRSYSSSPTSSQYCARFSVNLSFGILDTFTSNDRSGKYIGTCITRGSLGRKDDGVWHLGLRVISEKVIGGDH